MPSINIFLTISVPFKDLYINLIGFYFIVSGIFSQLVHLDNQFTFA